LQELRRRFIAKQVRERDVDGDQSAGARGAINPDGRILDERPEACLRLPQRLRGVCRGDGNAGQLRGRRDDAQLAIVAFAGGTAPTEQMRTLRPQEREADFPDLRPPTS